jgi:hypothetical protein
MHGLMPIHQFRKQRDMPMAVSVKAREPYLLVLSALNVSAILPRNRALAAMNADQSD